MSFIRPFTAEAYPVLTDTEIMATLTGTQTVTGFRATLPDTTPVASIDWMLWLSIAGVALAAMTYFKGR